MVLHFQGYPHVHAYLNIIDNADMALIGERIAETSQLLEGESIRNLLVRSMKAATDTQFAYYPEKTHGRIVAGDISAGSVFSIDPYNENISVVELCPSQIGISYTYLLTQFLNAIFGFEITMPYFASVGARVLRHIGWRCSRRSHLRCYESC